MIIVSRNKYIFLSVVVLAGIIYLGITGYIQIKAIGKIPAETFLFTSLVILLLLGIILSSILMKSKNITKEMKRLIHLSSIGGFTQGTSLKKFGSLGSQISELYYHLSLMNKKRAAKINSQKQLLEFIVSNFHLPLLVSDPTGGILYTSNVFTDKNEVKRTDLIDAPVTTILPELDIQVLLSKLETLHTFIEYDKGKSPVTIYPIHNNNNEIAYLVFIFGKQVLFFSEKKTDRERTIHTFLRNLISKQPVREKYHGS